MFLIQITNKSVEIQKRKLEKVNFLVGVGVFKMISALLCCSNPEWCSGVPSETTGNKFRSENRREAPVDNLNFSSLPAWPGQWGATVYAARSEGGPKRSIFFNPASKLHDLLLNGRYGAQLISAGVLVNIKDIT